MTAPTRGFAEFEAVWSAMPQPALVLDAGDRVVAANGAAESFFSASAAALGRRGLAELAGRDSRLAELVARARKGPLSLVDHGVELSRPEGGRRAVDAQAAALDPASGRVLLLLLPRELAEQMDRSLTHRAAARSVSGMAAMLAHEIKNPLAGISGAAQLLEMTLGEGERELCEMIRDECRRIETLLERVEEFGDTRPRPKEPVNVHDVLDRARRAAEAGFARHVRFTDEFDPSLPPIPGDPDQLMQVFQNLLKNAAEATPEVGGAIRLKTGYSPGVTMHGATGARESAPLLVTVEDNGRGVPPELRRDLFEPFVSSKPSGGGLGLALVSKVVAEHGGAVECESEPGRTVFRLRFPIWREGRSDQGAGGGGREG
jgi:two-component system nitrogen regulation sensor histidine kinase GlnL